MPETLEDAEDRPVPTRRVTFEVTAYWRHGVVQGGWYDMQTGPDGGETFSIPEFVVNEDTIRDAAAEQLTVDDWSEISGYVTGRLGAERGRTLLAGWRRAAEAEAGDGGA
jgi:hypothetical protein